MPVIELEDLIMGWFITSLLILKYLLNPFTFFQERKQFIIDHVFVLQHFRDAWTDGKWEEKLESEDCHGELRYRLFRIYFDSFFSFEVEKQ